VQLADLQLGLQVYLVVVLGPEAVLGLLSVLAHHDHRRLDRRQAREDKIQQDVQICPSADQPGTSLRIWSAMAFLTSAAGIICDPGLVLPQTLQDKLSFWDNFIASLNYGGTASVGSFFSAARTDTVLFSIRCTHSAISHTSL
jgi:hypothetical protein